MGEKKINYKFNPTSLFRGRPLNRGYFALLLCIEHCFTNIKFHTMDACVNSRGPEL